MSLKLYFLLLKCIAMFITSTAMPKSKFELAVLKYHEYVGIPEIRRIVEHERSNEKEIQSRITGGRITGLGKYPYFAGLVIELEGLGHIYSFCGASLISETRLVTAAHCWFDVSYQGVEILVVLGSTTLTYGGQRIWTKEVRTHELWQPKMLGFEYSHDIAIISIPPVVFSDTIKPISLPYGNMAMETFEGWTSDAVGFGRVADGGDKSPDLLEVSLKVISNNQCQRTLGEAVTPYIVCAQGVGNRNTCAGDSGGPLQVIHNGTAVLIGVTAFGLQTCETGEPGAYTRITAYLDWIENKM